MKLSLLMVVLFLLSGCTIELQDTSFKPSKKKELADEIRAKVAKRLKEKYNLQPSGSGGQMMDEIKMLALSFSYYDTLSIEESRELLIASVNEFVDAVNSEKRIHPYLFDCPFSFKNIEIRIVLMKPDGSSLGDDKLCVIRSLRGVLKYSASPSNQFLFETVHEETFDEAVQKINENKWQDQHYVVTLKKNEILLLNLPRSEML